MAHVWGRPIGQAEINVSFMVGGRPQPTFSPTSRFSGSGVKLFKKKFQNIGVIDRRNS